MACFGADIEGDAVADAGFVAPDDAVALVQIVFEVRADDGCTVHLSRTAADMVLAACDRQDLKSHYYYYCLFPDSIACLYRVAAGRLVVLMAWRTLGVAVWTYLGRSLPEDEIVVSYTLPAKNANRGEDLPIAQYHNSAVR